MDKEKSGFPFSHSQKILPTTKQSLKELTDSSSTNHIYFITIFNKCFLNKYQPATQNSLVSSVERQNEHYTGLYNIHGAMAISE